MTSVLPNFPTVLLSHLRQQADGFFFNTHQLLEKGFGELVPTLESTCLIHLACHLLSIS